MPTTRRGFLGSASIAALVPWSPPAKGARASEVAPAPRRPTADDPLGVRADFPVLERVTYLNGAYITPSPRQVVAAGRDFLEAKAVDPVVLGDMLAEVDAVRGKFAALIGAETAEVGTLYATSDGENIVTRALDLQPGDNVVVDDLHYETSYALYRELERARGIEMRIARSVDGAAPAEAFAPLIDARTRIVSVAWVSHQNGYCHDLRPLADLAHAHGAWLYADAIQGIGMLDLDVREAGVDALTSGTYKWLLGGYGVAPFYVRDPLLDRVPIDRAGSLNIAEQLPDHRFELHRDGRKYGYATMAFGAVYQLSAALDYLDAVGIERIEAHTVPLAQRLRDELAGQGFDVWTPSGNRSSIVSFFPGVDPERVRNDLDSAGIAVSVRDGGRQLRVGVALFNNDADIDRLLELTGTWRSG